MAINDRLPSPFRLCIIVAIHYTVLLMDPRLSFATNPKAPSWINVKRDKGNVKDFEDANCPEPKYCYCKRNGVFCRKNITFIPKVPPDTRRLSMTNCNLAAVDSGTFANLTNITLTTLHLNYCGLRRLSEDAFRNVIFRKDSLLSLSDNVVPNNGLQRVICHPSMAKLKTLVLDRMALKYIPPKFFECLSNTSIKHLSLIGNKLQNFSGNEFSSTSNLEHLELDHNDLNFIELINVKSLNTLSLTANPINKIPTFVDEGGGSLCPNLASLIMGRVTAGVIRSSDFRGLQSLVFLNMEYNIVEKLPKNFLTEMPKLKTINLGHSSIRRISKYAFNSTSLDYIDLSFMQFPFKEITNWDIFTGCPNLRKLVLTGNDLSSSLSRFVKLINPLKKLVALRMKKTGFWRIPDGLLNRLPELTLLDLSDNSISHWSSKLFHGGTKLNRLYLERNLITLVNETSFPSFFLKRLRKLHLGKNPFVCTCDLLWFRNWLNQAKTRTIDIRHLNLYQCSYPKEWKGKPLYHFRPTISECTPLNLPVIVGASLGSLVAIVVFAIVIIIRYRMHIRYFVFLFRSRMKQYAKIDDVVDYCYDAFVVYSSQDRDWVIQELLPRVEYQEGYKLSLYDRDFIPGRDIVDNVIEHMESSRMVIVVLSDNFAESEWCKWELTMAQNKLLDERKDILILVKLDEIKPGHLNNRLMLLMRDKVYIDWSDCDLGRDFFWERLVSALARPITRLSI